MVNRVLSLNAGCGTEQEKPPRQIIDATIAELVRTHVPGLVMVQEYRFKGGSAFSKFTPLRDLLPGGWRRWKVAQLEFDVGGMVPLVLWDDALWDGTPLKLAPSGSPGATPASARARTAAGEPFAGRYTAVMLASKVSPAKEAGAKVLAVAYHGQQYAAPPAKDGPPPQELSDEQRLANAQRFLELVGAAAARAGVPALVGGDWGASFGFEGRPVPGSEEWVAQLRPVAAYHPCELDCYRYRNNMAPVDFLATVNPVERGLTLEVAGVTAVAHAAELQDCFDHDPLLASFSICPGEEAVVPPPPLGSTAAAAPTQAAAARMGSSRKNGRAPAPQGSHGDLGELSQKNDVLLQQLAWLRQEAGAEEVGAGGLGAAAEEERPEGGAGVGTGAEAGGEGGAGALLLCLEGSGSTCSRSEGGGSEGEWRSLVTQLASELALVKESAAQLVAHKDKEISALKGRLLAISETAAAAAAAPLGASAGESSSGVGVAAAGGPQPSPVRGGGAERACPLTPEQSFASLGGRRSPAGSTNGR